MSVRLAQRIVRLAAWLAPPHLRRRWTEEWLGEIQAAADAPVSSRRAKASPLRRALGAPRDAWTVRMDRRLRARFSAPPTRTPIANGLTNDIRQALRQLTRRPGVALVSVLSLALGMAVTTATFSFVNAALLADRPGVVDRDSLSQVFIRAHMSMGTLRMLSSRREYAALRDGAPSSAALIAEGAAELPVDTDGEPGLVNAVFVSDNYFSGLGTTPLAGRLLGPADDTIDADAVIIDTRIWRERYGGVPDVVGQTMTVAGRIKRIVGVAPQGFTGWSVQIEVDEGEPAPRIWLPLAAAAGWAHLTDDRALHLSLAARLHPGASQEQVAAALMPLMPLYAEASGRFSPDRRAPELSVLLRPLAAGSEESTVETVLSVALFMLAPLTVLGIGCANVANLRLAHASERTRDLAVRLSLGGSRWRVVRPLVIECLALAIGAAAIGGLAARAILTAVESLLVYAPLDVRVFAFMAAATGLVVLLSGLAPAWLVTRRLGDNHLRQSPQAGGLAHSKLRSTLVIVQVALSLALLTVGALSVRTLVSQQGLTPLDADDLVVVEVDLRSVGGTPAVAADLAPKVAARLATDPRFSDVAIGESVFFRPGQSAVVEGGEAGAAAFTMRIVAISDGWLESLGQRLLAGRHLDVADGAGAIVVNETMARAIASDGQVVGTTLTATIALDAATRPAPSAVHIVGVVSDGPQRPGGRSRERVAYRLFDAPLSPVFTVIARTAQRGAVSRDVRLMVASLTPSAPWVEVETLAAIIRREMSPWRYLASVFGTLGGMSLVLAAAGLYAVIAYVVSLRTREIGIRMAVGARPVDVLHLVFRQAIRMVGIGVAIGVVLTVPVAYGMRAIFVGVSPADPVAFGSIAGLLLLVGLAATAMPARRAARVDPVSALRSE